MRSVMSVDANGETIERRRDPARQLRLEIGVEVVVREMREVGAFGADQPSGADGFRNAEMRGVFGAKESVDDEHLRAFENLYGLVGKRLRVGDVGKWPDAVTEDVDLSVRDLHWNDVEIRDREVFARFHGTRNGFRLRRSRLRPHAVVEDVAKAARDLFDSRS